MKTQAGSHGATPRCEHAKLTYNIQKTLPSPPLTATSSNNVFTFTFTNIINAAAINGNCERQALPITRSRLASPPASGFHVLILLSISPLNLPTHIITQAQTQCMHTQAPLHLAQLSALSCRQRRLHDLTPLTLQILHSETSHNLTQQLSCTLFTKPHIAQTSATTIAPSQHSITAFLQHNLHFASSVPAPQHNHTITSAAHIIRIIQPSRTISISRAIAIYNVSSKNTLSRATNDA